MSPAEAVTGFRASITDAAWRIHRSLLGTRARYLRAWLALSDIDPREAVVVTWEEYRNGRVERHTSVVKRGNVELRKHLWDLVRINAVTRESVQRALEQSVE